MTDGRNFPNLRVLDLFAFESVCSMRSYNLIYVDTYLPAMTKFVFRLSVVVNTSGALPRGPAMMLINFLRYSLAAPW